MDDPRFETQMAAGCLGLIGAILGFLAVLDRK